MCGLGRRQSTLGTRSYCALEETDPPERVPPVSPPDGLFGTLEGLGGFECQINKTALEAVSDLQGRSSIWV